MKSDFEMIVHRLGTNLKYVNIYPIGDVHVGSREFNEVLFKKWVRTVENDPVGYWVYVGDMSDNGLKNSKTNVYRQTMSPREQKEWLKRELRPIAHKNMGGVQGNHEKRTTRETDDCPLYDVMCKLNIEDMYREEMAVIKVNLGHKSKDRQYSYMMAMGHGGSPNKKEKFVMAIDGIDIFFSGHTHSPESKFPAKILVDAKNETISIKPYTTIVVPSFAEYGGYAVGGLYTPQSQAIPMVRLYGDKKGWETKWTIEM